MSFQRSHGRVIIVRMCASWLRNNFFEIESDRQLHFYGILLAFTHFLSFFFWWPMDFANRSLVCFPVFPQCRMLDGFWRDWASVYLLALAGCALGSMVLFYRRSIRRALGLLALASCLRLFFHLSDYKLMGNYHYMSHLVILAFFFLPEKRNTIRCLIVLFYLAAGLIKINTDWLSGLALPSRSFFQGQLAEVLSALVILLEMAGSLVLLSSHWQRRSMALGCFVLFHFISWYFVGFFYPLLMLSLLGAFVLFPGGSRLPRGISARLALGLFVIAQILPWIWDRNSGITGQWRILSLNMMDSRAVCETRYILESRSGWIEHVKSFEKAGLRIQCDWVLVADYGEKLCSEHRGREGFEDIIVDHQVRRASDHSWIDQKTFSGICDRPLKVNVFGIVSQPGGDLR